MSARTRATITPGDRVIVEIPYSDRPVLRPLIGRLRAVEVTDDGRAIIYEEDGRRYQADGRTVRPVRLHEAGIFTDPATGELRAQVYHLPPRDLGPFPLPPHYLQVAQPGPRGGIAWMLWCRCGRGCVCGTCGERLIDVPTRDGLDWWTRSMSDDGRHSDSSQRCGPPSPCPGRSQPDPSPPPQCCALPMMLAPIAWACRREPAHQRPYLWPASAAEDTP